MRPHRNFGFAFPVGRAVVPHGASDAASSDGVARYLLAAGVLTAALVARPAVALYQEVTCERNFMQGEIELGAQALEWVRSRTWPISSFLRRCCRRTAPGRAQLGVRHVLNRGAHPDNP